MTLTDIEEVSKKSYGYSGCDLYNICREASMIPLKAVDNIVDVALSSGCE
jgi:SpoVK/Ycf46/Vps4 family AAA+-type ATPase